MYTPRHFPSSCVFPLMDISYFLCPRLRNVLVCVKKPTDVDCLSAPNITRDGPVEGELQRAPVERPGSPDERLANRANGPRVQGMAVQDVAPGGSHCGVLKEARGPMGEIEAPKAASRSSVTAFEDSCCCVGAWTQLRSSDLNTSCVWCVVIAAPAGVVVRSSAGQLSRSTFHAGRKQPSQLEPH